MTTTGNTLTIGGVIAYREDMRKADQAAMEARLNYNAAVKALAEAMADFHVGDIVLSKGYQWSADPPRQYRVRRIDGRLLDDGRFTVSYRCAEQTKGGLDHCGKHEISIAREDIMEKVGHRD